MSKRKILILAMSLCMVAILATGGTLAYFFDTDTEKNVFTFGNVEIELEENFPDPELIPGKPGDETNLVKEVKVNNIGSEDAYLWIEVWIPSALDDGDDNSPAAPGLGNSLHFNYPKGMTETKSTYLGAKSIDGVSYNGYVHYFAGATEGVASGDSSELLLTGVYMDWKVEQCTDGHDKCLILLDGTHYNGSWELIINGVGFQSEGVPTIETAIETYYDKALAGHIW